MELRFWADPESGLPHNCDNRVTEEEVQQVLRRPGEESPGRNQSRIRLGQTDAERAVVEAAMRGKQLTGVKM